MFSCHVPRNQWQFSLEKSSSIGLREKIREVSLIRKFTCTKAGKSFSLSLMTFGRVKKQVVNSAPLQCCSGIKAVTGLMGGSLSSSVCAPVLSVGGDVHKS